VIPHRLTLHFAALCLFLFSLTSISAQKQKAPPGGRIAVVVDERLSALRATADLTGKLVRRVSRGRLVAIRATKKNAYGIVFYFVNVSSRTHGWIQREAVVSSSQPGDDRRLLELINDSTEFDRIVRARVFLDHFPRSPLRPEVLLVLGDTAEQVSEKLSRDASRHIEDKSTPPQFCYFLNYTGLDRYNRQRVRFVFDPKTRRLHYDGAAWRELIHRFPRSTWALEAKKRLTSLATLALID
jgi:hypothetical protein